MFRADQVSITVIQQSQIQINFHLVKTRDFLFRSSLDWRALYISMALWLTPRREWPLEINYTKNVLILIDLQ